MDAELLRRACLKAGLEVRDFQTDGKGPLWVESGTVGFTYNLNDPAPFGCGPAVAWRPLPTTPRRIRAAGG